MGSATIERDEGIERVSDSNKFWMIRALKAVVRLNKGWTGTGEDLRTLLEPTVGTPSHSNAWGALVMHAKKQNLLVPTGYFVQMRLPKSHARITREYVR